MSKIVKTVVPILFKGVGINVEKEREFEVLILTPGLSESNLITLTSDPESTINSFLILINSGIFIETTGDSPTSLQGSSDSRERLLGSDAGCSAHFSSHPFEKLRSSLKNLTR